MPPNLLGKRSGARRVEHEPPVHKNLIIASQRLRSIQRGDIGKGRHNFAQLVKEVIDRSESDVWEIARKEWFLIDLYQEEDGTCPCGHSPITDRCVLKNEHNDNEMIVGNVCVHRFDKETGEKSKKIFQGYRKITQDFFGRTNEEFLKHAQNQGFITSDERTAYDAIPDRKYRNSEQKKTMGDLNMKMIRRWNAKKPKPKSCSQCPSNSMSILLKQVSDEVGEADAHKLVYRCEQCQIEANFKEQKDPEEDDEDYDSQEDAEDEEDEEHEMDDLANEDEEDEGSEEDDEDEDEVVRWSQDEEDDESEDDEEYREGESGNEDDSYSEISGTKNVNSNQPSYDEDGEAIY